MALSKEEIEVFKKQLRKQVGEWPEDQKSKAEEQINALSEQELEEMLKQQGGVQSSVSQKGIFRMIVDGDIPSKKIDESKDVIAVVSKRAASKGHVLIIPKKVVGEVKGLPNSAFTLAKKITKKMGSKLKTEGVEIQTASVFGEIVINVIPVYDKPIDLTQTYEASDEEIEEVYRKLRVVKKKKLVKVKKKLSQRERAVRLRRRIP
jgi:histidine triad (HIT) family protein